MPVRIGETDELHPRSVPAFCRRHGICRATFYNHAKRGLMPDLLRIGARTIITEDAEAAWIARSTKKAAA